MTRTKGIGKTGMALAATATAAMCALSYFFGPESRLSGGLGICLPSPNLWSIPPLWSWIANTAALGLLAIWMFLLNRHFNFIRSTQPVLPAMFLVFVASNPWLTDYLTASTIICAINLLAINVMFGSYRQPNATQQMFLIGTVISVASMFQYASLPYTLAYIIAGIIMKAFRIKEFLAMVMGLAAPYWVGVGLGIIGLDAFRMPEITNLFNGFTGAPDLFALMLSVGLAIFFGLALGMNNSIKLYAGNSRTNAMNMTINMVGLVSIICVVADFNNMMAYLTTLYFTVAVQIANLCALWHIRKEWLAAFIPGIIYIGFFIFFLLS